MMGGMVDRVLAMKPGDFMPVKDKDKGDASLSLHDQMVKDDPYFDERMKIMRRVIGEELVKISAVMEPKLREGLARDLGAPLKRQVRFDRQIHFGGAHPTEIEVRIGPLTTNQQGHQQ